MRNQSERITKFTDDQLKALDRIEQFAKSNPKANDFDARVLVIIGPAGSGKTTLIRYGLEEYINRDLSSNLDDEGAINLFSSLPNVVGVCVAHQAKKNLKKSIPYVKTFASYFGMKEVYGEEGQTSFEIDYWALPKSTCRQPVKFAVHDEVSMYDKEMINIILSETHPKTKIILMGDSCQLPPINTEGDEDSPAFHMFSNVIELTERHRQTKDNPILELSDILREEIKGSQNVKRCLEAMKQDNVIDGKGYVNIFYSDFLKHYKNLTTNYRESKVIVYRRNTVANFNQRIRSFLYPKEDAMYVKGEIVYMNNTFKQEESVRATVSPADHLEELMNSQSQPSSYYCYNSDEYTINNVEIGTVEGVKVYKIFFDKADRPDIGVANPYFPMLHPAGIDAYNKIFYYRRSKALNETDKKKKSAAWGYFYDFKNKFADCSYAYCLTGHKAQGSGYKYVYVDINDILTVGPISDKRKLQAIYTAITRATDLVILLKSK